MSEQQFNKLITDVEVIKTKIIDLEKILPCKIHLTDIADHETRIRNLEEFKAKTIGALIIGSSLGGIIGAGLTIVFNIIMSH